MRSRLQTRRLILSSLAEQLLGSCRARRRRHARQSVLTLSAQILLRLSPPQRHLNHLLDLLHPPAHPVNRSFPPLTVIKEEAALLQPEHRDCCKIQPNPAAHSIAADP